MAEQTGRFQLVECTYSHGGHHLDSLLDHPWDADPCPQVVTVKITAIPRTALSQGIARRPLLSVLLAKALAEIAPRGLPGTPAPKDSWWLRIELDSSAQTAVAILMPFNGVEHAVTKTIELSLRGESPSR